MSDTVLASVPRAFNFTRRNHAVVEVRAGRYELLKEIAESWYARAHGVQILEADDTPQAEVPAPEHPQPTIPPAEVPRMVTNGPQRRQR